LTPAFVEGEVQKLLNGVETFTHTGLHDRALLAALAYTGYRRLVKNVAGTFTLLWEDTTAYAPDTPYRLTVSAIGTELRGYVDGVMTFVVDDADVAQGRVELYTWETTAASFWHVRVYPSSLGYADWFMDDRFQALVTQTWTFVDEGTIGAPSAWAVDPKVGLQQTSLIDGTYAIAGQTSWDDYRYTVRLTSGDWRRVPANRCAELLSFLDVPICRLPSSRS
jgi:hypothetical protein